MSASLQQAASKSRTHFVKTRLQGFLMPLTLTSNLKITNFSIRYSLQQAAWTLKRPQYCATLERKSTWTNWKITSFVAIEFFCGGWGGGGVGDKLVSPDRYIHQSRIFMHNGIKKALRNHYKLGTISVIRIKKTLQPKSLFSR